MVVIPPDSTSGVKVVLLTELREGGLGIVTYMMGQMKWSCINHVPELGEVELIERWWCRSLCVNLEVAMSFIP